MLLHAAAATISVAFAAVVFLGGPKRTPHPVRGRIGEALVLLGVAVDGHAAR